MGWSEAKAAKSVENVCTGFTAIISQIDLEVGRRGNDQRSLIPFTY